MRLLLPSVLALCLGCGLLGALHLPGNHFIRASLAMPMLWLVPLGLLLVLDRKKVGRSRSDCAGNLPFIALFAGLIVFLYSSATLHRNFFFLKWSCVEGGGAAACFLSGASILVFVSACALPFCLRGLTRRLRAVLTMALLFVFQALCFYALLSVTRGAALYRDDHPSFIFRLWEFARTFPSLVNYIPYWNAGVVHFTGVTSGILALGLAFWPLWAWLPVEQVYTWVVAFCFIGLAPLSAAFSLRAMGAGRSAAAIAGLLTLCSCRQFFLWSLHYGTVGAGLASVFVLPFIACLYRVIVLGKTTWREAAGLVVSACFMGAWAPCAVGGVLTVPGMLLFARRWTWRKLALIAACGVIVCLFFANSLWALYSQGNELMGHVMVKHVAAAKPAAAELFVSGWRALLSHFYEMNPVLLFFGVLGVFVLPNRRQAIWLAPVIIGLLVLTGWGEIWKPNLQLRRMAILLAFVAVAPAALALDRIFATRSRALAWARSLVPALLILTGLNAFRIYRNQWPAQYVTIGPMVNDLVAWVKAEVPEGGRVAFAGKIVHFVGRGHVAPLPMFTGREMMSCDYYHFPHGMSEYVFPPRSFCNSQEDVFRYFDLFNVTHVMTYHRSWQAFFRERPGCYEECADFQGLAAFRIKRSASLFEKGNGKVQADFNRLDVVLDSGEEEAVLRYAWADGLVAKPPATVFPVEYGKSVRLIGVRPNGSGPVVIRFHPQRGHKRHAGSESDAR